MLNFSFIFSFELFLLLLLLLLFLLFLFHRYFLIFKFAYHFFCLVVLGLLLLPGYKNLFQKNWLDVFFIPPKANAISYFDSLIENSTFKDVALNFC